MSEENKNILKRANAAVVAGNNEGFLAFCADEIAWSTVGGETLRGKQAVREWMRDAYRAPPQFSLHRMIAEGDRVVAIGDISAPDAQGRMAPHAYCDVWRFLDGKMVELQAYVVPLESRNATQDN